MPTTDIAPAWLRHVATDLHEQLPTDVRDDWTARLHVLLDEVPYTEGLFAVHVWQAGTVLPLLAEAAKGGEAAVFVAPQDLHRAATRGRTPDQDTWRTALTPMLLHLYDAAYDRAGAYSEAHTGARDYALGNGFSAADADGYGHEYAQLSSDANARACAEAHAEALGPALARAYADDGCEAYADTFPAAQLRAVVRVLTGRGDPDPAVRLAEGLLSALAASRP
ncbi:hypothetical protein [Streptomyces sp. MBT62]|uniref:hypothetical protein n=1 Tax=Streptomyces sp. MBT62 TaxID=2800410 RepID=UPI00190984FF|nr:hypothetical protein [Streptomyces sp. MBT62]MBK3570053.1 hypothetical protein [Streptomyces sp. MBT62]